MKTSSEALTEIKKVFDQTQIRLAEIEAVSNLVIVFQRFIQGIKK